MSKHESLENVKKLREITGVGFKDCKIALDEKTRGYTCVSAIQTAFSILQSGVIDGDNKSELKKLSNRLLQAPQKLISLFQEGMSLTKIGRLFMMK